MSKNEIDDALGAIPQPEYLEIRLITMENRYEFPEDLISEKSWDSWVEHCIMDSYSKGFYVIESKIGALTENQVMRGTGILILKVAKLPLPKRKDLD